jgi:hypothetical protein
LPRFCRLGGVPVFPKDDGRMTWGGVRPSNEGMT